MRRASLLVVDDQPGSLEYMRITFEEGDYRVRTARNGVEAMLAVEAELPDAVFSDLRMPEMDGVALFQRIRQRWPELPLVFVTVEQDLKQIVDLVRLGAANYLVKPVKPAVFLDAAARAVSERPASKPPRTSRTVPELVGTSRAMVEARHLIALAAAGEVNVLIVGETGTGKELAARAVHRCSGRGNAPFIACNCAAIPHALCDSAFFGHVRGAFTGADRERDGLLVQADGGILFLDELESLDAAHQAKLLRVLDDGEVRAVGSEVTRRVSVRFLAASNRDPASMIADGTLREDLYYRLRGYQIVLPPLRDRREDIPLLALHFLRRSPGGLSPAVMLSLQDRAWPGNVRELRNAIRTAEAAASGGSIEAHHLPPSWSRDGTDRPARDREGLLQGTLRELERRAIEHALERHRGNRTRAARALGIDRSTLRRKMADKMAE